MASPQKENGYTPVANEILDEIVFRKFNGSQFRIIIKVWRLTYGYGRTSHEFSLSFLQDVTGLSESSIKRELAFLIKNKVLLLKRKYTSTEGRILSFNKNYEKWNIPKSGDFVEEQMDLFPIIEGSDLTPPNDEEGGFRFDPSEGSDLTPPSDVSRGQIRPPYKEIRSLKKSFKEKEQMFEIFYSFYPRKISRKKAEASWKTLCKEKDFDPDIAIAYTTNFSETCKLLKTEPKFIPHPATFLNQKRYEDYPVVDPEGLAAANETKFGSNFDFLKNQLGGGGNDQRRGCIIAGESIGSLPEQGS